MNKKIFMKFFLILNEQKFFHENSLKYLTPETRSDTYSKNYFRYMYKLPPGRYVLVFSAAPKFHKQLTIIKFVLRAIADDIAIQHLKLVLINILRINKYLFNVLCFLKMKSRV